MPRLDIQGWLCLMHEVELRVPLAFDLAHVDLTMSEGGAVATTATGFSRAAANKVVMRSRASRCWRV